ncbi:GAF domain-containing protein [Rhodobacteraceae bacterium 2CG4]|uniref:GAF domain-containing protein n=1 Tax=Halovulum marinum TaxID=2662447 RepID=A0A6L5Z819_9RHOB|nr:histidine kinase dimerization/phosphoacceptor domain -containing protein [Halovulum marinum]MSU92340.1 GAF domain-containing protein [Halovulum marinum]
MEALPHPRQQERLKTLHAYNVLDTERERDFDQIVELAARICGTPISVINLIDERRQWFKAETGLGVRETPLETSLCAHAILQDEFVEIPDTLKDPRMATNPMCLDEPGLRFYAGALLVAENGLPLGTLCVLDHTPRTLNDLQRDTLRVLARQVMNQLDLRRALRLQTMLRKEVDHRVKNSLMTVAALTRMQARAATGDDTRRALAAVHGRIETVAALHQELSKSESGDRISLGRYLRGVVSLIDGHRPAHVVVDVACGEDIDVSSARASNIGAIVNEFVTNSFKHAFPGGREGTVIVTCGSDSDGFLELTCRDDGVGFARPADDDGDGDASLGLKIIRASAASLGGAVEVAELDRGYGIRLRFPAKGGDADAAAEAISA